MPRRKATEEYIEKEPTPTTTKDKSQKILSGILEDKYGHFNYIEPQNYKVSTGSLNLDLETGGGIEPCIFRCGGPSEAGKTSFSLNIAKNFLKEKNRKALYFLSDKEVSNNLIKRSGITFVEDVDKWVDGTCFILRTNVYETVCNTIKKLIAEKGITYCFILDSMDNFAPKAALEVDFGESSQKGGTSAITSHFFKCFNILLPRLGHLTILISQIRDQFTINKYQKVIPKQLGTSGGRAMEHAATWAFEFDLPMGEDIFWEGEKNKSKRLGHNCVIKIKKSTNEKTNTTVKFPIKYGRSDGNSIWKEREMCDQLIVWEFIKRSGAWIKFSDVILDECKEKGIEIQPQIQGLNNLIEYLENNKQLSKLLNEKFSDLLS